MSFQGIKPLSKAIVRFKEYDFSPSISFEANIYMSSLTRFFPDKLKMRIESEFFQIIIEPAKRSAKYSFSFTSQGRSSLAKLRDILKLLTVFKKSASGMLLTIEPESLPPISGNISITTENVFDFSGMYKIAEMATFICKKLGVSENDFSVNIDDLANFAKPINFFYGTINSDPKELKVSFSVEGEIVQEGRKIACMFLYSIRIGAQTIGCLVSLIGIPSFLRGKEYELIPDEVLIDYPMLAGNEKIIEKKVIDNNFDDIAKKYQEKGIIAIRMVSQEQVI